MATHVTPLRPGEPPAPGPRASLDQPTKRAPSRVLARARRPC